MKSRSVKLLVRRAYASWRRPPKGLGDLVPEFPLQPTITRTIHQVYTGDRLPEEIRTNIETFRAANPGWDYQRYDGRSMPEFILSNYGPRMLEYYLKINPRYTAARIDLFKYLLMYRVGGVYLDAKSSITKPLASTLKSTDQFLLSTWHNGPGEPDEGTGLHPELVSLPGGEYQMWYIAAAAGHPFLRAVIIQTLANISLYNPLIHGTGANVLRVTGPIVYALAIAPLLNSAPHRFVDAERDLGFVYSIYGSTPKHKGLFGSHYSQLSAPIVLSGPIATALHTMLVPVIVGKRWIGLNLRQRAARAS